MKLQIINYFFFMCYTIYTGEAHFRNTKMNSKVLVDRSRSWAFTLNNPSKEDIKGLSEGAWSYVFQLEQGSTTNTPHLQGFLKFKDAKSLLAVKKINPKMHLEKAKNAQACKNYCTKIDTSTGQIWTNMEDVKKKLEKQGRPLETLEQKIKRIVGENDKEMNRLYEEDHKCDDNSCIYCQLMRTDIGYFGW